VPSIIEAGAASHDGGVAGLPIARVFGEKSFFIITGDFLSRSCP
jgi:hypothetical protein